MEENNLNTQPKNEVQTPVQASPFDNFNSTASPAPTAVPTPPIERKRSKKPLLIALGVVLVLALGVGAYFLISSRSNGGETGEEEEEEVVDFSTVDPTPTGITEEEYETYLNEKIETAESDVEALEYELTKVILLFSDGDYDAAEAALDEYDVDSLKTYQEKFMVYNTYARLYDEKGDTEKFDEYHALASQMHQAYIEYELEPEPTE